MYQVSVEGEASQKTYKVFHVLDEEIHEDLLTVMRRYNIPVASSCLGEGVCRKCLINGSLLACKTSLKDLIKAQKPANDLVKISISYL